MINSTKVGYLMDKFISYCREQGTFAALGKGALWTGSYFHRILISICWMLGYSLNPLVRTGWPRTDISFILGQLRKEGIPVESVMIDSTEYNDYVSKAQYPSHYYHGNPFWNFSQKMLEHMLSLKYLDLRQEDVFIDIASARSPFA